MIKALLEPGDMLADKYRIEALLGQGGMGAVFRAVNVDLGRPVAIKVLLPQLAHDADTVARFRQEARAAAGIGHPSIIDILDLGRTAEGAEFIVMEYLRGESLGEKLKREGRLSLPAALTIAGGILDALEAAHACGITHRDLKPDNIFLAAPPISLVKVLDFGISKLADGQEEGIHTATGALMGTPGYMAPEQAQGKRDVGPAADLYAFGAILYQMLAGRPLFGGQSLMEILLKVVGETPEPLAKQRGDLPPELTALVMALVAKDPTARPASATVVRAALEALSRPPTPDVTEEAFAATLPPAQLSTLAPADVGEVDKPISDAAPSTEADARPMADTIGAEGRPRELTEPQLPRRPLWPVFLALALGTVVLVWWLVRPSSKPRPSTTSAATRDAGALRTDRGLPPAAKVAAPRHEADARAADATPKTPKKRTPPRGKHRPRKPEPKKPDPKKPDPKKPDPKKPDPKKPDPKKPGGLTLPSTDPI